MHHQYFHFYYCHHCSHYQDQNNRCHSHHYYLQGIASKWGVHTDKSLSCIVAPLVLNFRSTSVSEHLCTYPSLNTTLTLSCYLVREGQVPNSSDTDIDKKFLVTNSHQHALCQEMQFIARQSWKKKELLGHQNVAGNIL